MLDTAHKNSGPLRRHLDVAALSEFVRRARDHGLFAGLAGSLREEDVPALLALDPDYLGFRGALCAAGQRSGALDADAFARIRAAIPATGRSASVKHPRLARGGVTSTSSPSGCAAREHPRQTGLIIAAQQPDRASRRGGKAWEKRIDPAAARRVQRLWPAPRVTRTDFTSTSSAAPSCRCEPGCEAVRSHVPACGNLARREHHRRWHPHRHACLAPVSRAIASPLSASDESRLHTRQHQTVLLHRQQRHPMRAGVVEALLPLRIAYGVGERAAARARLTTRPAPTRTSTASQPRSPGARARLPPSLTTVTPRAWLSAAS